MKKIIPLILSLFFSFHMLVHADEGMWLPFLIEKLNIAEMQEMGCELSAEQIYSINQSSLKDAIVALDYGSCTGELVSPEGLIFTNHHCAYGEIQEHSSMENDYLANGFWARSKDEELPNPGKTASFLIRIENVSDKIMPFLSDTLTEYERYDKVRILSEPLIQEATKGTHYEARVQNLFHHNAYYLFVYETFRDIRLVGAPPSSVGKFGGDVDNWMWPRHTGDFAIFRVYSGPDGKPAEYAPDNIPVKPRHHLPISLEGYEKGDFAMILGYPGSTSRYLTSYGIKEVMEVTNPARIKIRGIKQEIWAEDMAADPKIRIAYASKYSGSSNYWKYSIGQNKGLKKLNVYEKKKAIEERFEEWVNQDEQRKEKYGEALSLIEEAYKNREKYRHAFLYLMESLMYGTEIIAFSNQSMTLYRTLQNTPDSTQQINAIIAELKSTAEDFYKDYSPSTDQKVFAAMLQLYHEEVDQEFHISMWDWIQKKYKGDLTKYADKVFKKTAFASKEAYFELLDSKNIKAFDKDPVYKIMLSTVMQYMRIYGAYDAIGEDLSKGERLFLGGLMEMDKNKTFYPDANSTMRITYGTVGDYKARDAVYYHYQTTMEGIIEKYDPNDLANFFNTPEDLLEIYRNKDYGRYGEGDMMPVAFTTNNDITGGNSGSPVINGKGHLIGIAFDGNWEAMSGDIAFETELQKCINVDIRYVMLIIDKLAGAQNLIDEMTIIEKTVEEKTEDPVESKEIEEVEELQP